MVARWRQSALFSSEKVLPLDLVIKEVRKSLAHRRNEGEEKPANLPLHCALNLKNTQNNL